MMKLAYLAPELPALSATFVYNEIFEIEKLGVQVVPFSVHQPAGNFDDNQLRQLRQRVTSLYTTSLSKVFKSHLRLLFRRPKPYIKTFTMLLADMWRIGFQRTALGQAYRFLYSAVLADELLKHRCEHIHVHFAHIPTDLAMYASSYSGISFSVTSHANDLFERGWLLKQKVERSKFFGTISEFNKRFLSEQQVEIEKVKVIRCGVDLTEFKTRRWKALAEPPHIGVVGRLVEKKGIDVLLNTLALLKQKGMVIQLSVAGDGPLLAELRNLTASLGLGEQITFLGAMPHSEVSGFIKSLDAFVLPCKVDSHGDMDGIPVVLMESMLAGVPVVSTQISGIPELVIDGETGFCVAAGDEEALSQAIETIIGDRTRTRQLAVNAVSRVKASFSLSGNAADLKQLIES